MVIPIIRLLVAGGGRKLLGLTTLAAIGYAAKRYRQRLSPDTDPLEDIETRFDRAVEFVRRDLHGRGESLSPDLVRRLAPYEDATVEAIRSWVRRNAQKLAEATDSSVEAGGSGRGWRRV
jgi:hypothetical protein